MVHIVPRLSQVSYVFLVCPDRCTRRLQASVVKEHSRRHSIVSDVVEQDVVFVIVVIVEIVVVLVICYLVVVTLVAVCFSDAGFFRVGRTNEGPTEGPTEGRTSRF